MMTIAEALHDERLLGAAIDDITSWRTWLTVLKAAYALPLDEDERAIFAAVAGGRALPSKRRR
jgi:hypothetical protein